MDSDVLPVICLFSMFNHALIVFSLFLITQTYSYMIKYAYILNFSMCSFQEVSASLFNSTLYIVPFCIQHSVHDEIQAHSHTMFLLVNH